MSKSDYDPVLEFLTILSDVAAEVLEEARSE
jgi:hypothetical protein